MQSLGMRRGVIGGVVVVLAISIALAVVAVVRADSAAQRFDPRLKEAQLIWASPTTCGSISQSQPGLHLSCSGMGIVMVLSYQGTFAAPSCGPASRSGTRSASECPTSNQERVYVDLLNDRAMFGSNP